MALHSPQQIVLSNTLVGQVSLNNIHTHELVVPLSAQVATTPIDMDYFGHCGAGRFRDTLLPRSKCGAGEARVPSAATASTKNDKSKR